MQIRSKAGGLVIAVRRGDETIKGPGPDFYFAEEDDVLIVGETVDLEMLESMFTQN